MTAPTTGPDPETIREVLRRLRARQGPFLPGAPLPIIDQVVATVLSQNTSDVNSGRAFTRLKERFPSWEQVADAPPDEVADAIRPGGLAAVKARRIRRSSPRSSGGKDASTSTGCAGSATRRPRPTSPRCPGSARRPPPACSCSRWAAPRSPWTRTCTASSPGSAGCRRAPPPQGAGAAHPARAAGDPPRAARGVHRARPYRVPRPGAAVRRVRAARPVRVRRCRTGQRGGLISGRRATTVSGGEERLEHAAVPVRHPPPDAPRWAGRARRR